MPSLSNAAAVGEFSVEPVFQLLDATCGDELADEVANEMPWRIYGSAN
ncbi:MAG: hypothetical protein J0H48_13125 [Nitrosospira multiformis]|nr:hypothetical protein [Nitrosospira multiformis]